MPGYLADHDTQAFELKKLRKYLTVLTEGSDTTSRIRAVIVLWDSFTPLKKKENQLEFVVCFMKVQILLS